jgi:hypothetical protein
MAVMDIYMIYQFVKKLVTPFTEMPAYRAGLIDGNGKFLKQRSQFTPAEQQICTYFDILVINLKRLIAMVPGGRSRLANYAAALFLTRTYESYQKNPVDTMFNLEEEFMKTLAEVEAIYEEAPSNSASGGGVYLGTKPGQTPVVTRAAAKKYKRGNSLALKLLRRKSVDEDTTLQYHSELNPKLWQDNKLKPEVRGKLLQIAATWIKFANIPHEAVIETIITGGNVNYNYTPLSDIDLHLVVSRDALNPNRALTDDYLQDKKILWSLSHQNINIYGYPVELYAQDVNEQPHENQGVYSITKNEWIAMPRNIGIDFAADAHLQKKVQYYKDLIDKMIMQQATDGTFDMIKQKIKKMRGDSIAKSGEFAFGNLVFKELRNQGYLDKMDAYQKSNQDKALSLS